MPNTKKKYHSKKYKTHKKTKYATIEQIRQNRRRNKMLRNMRMGRGRVLQSGGGFVSQFIGKPWTPDSIGSNYYSLNSEGVGTGVVPKFDAGQPLGSARYPTQLGPQLAKLGQTGGGSRKKSKKNNSGKNISGGGIIDDLGSMVDNVKYSFGKLNNTLAGENPPPNPNPYNQPISKNMI